MRRICYLYSLGWFATLKFRNIIIDNSYLLSSYTGRVKIKAAMMSTQTCFDWCINGYIIRDI